MTTVNRRPGVFDSVADAIGNTPLVRLNRVTEGVSATVYLELGLSPAGWCTTRRQQSLSVS